MFCVLLCFVAKMMQVSFQMCISTWQPNTLIACTFREESNLLYAKLCRILFREIVVVRSFKEDQTADLQLLEFCHQAIIGNSRERHIPLAK